MTRTRSTLALAIVLSALTLVACGREPPASALVGVEVIAVDDRESMPSAAGPTMDGGTLDLADLVGDIVVLNSWASWCAPCEEEIPAFVDLAESAPDGLSVVGLNVSDDPTAAAEFEARLGMDYPSIVDPQGLILQTIPGVPPKSLPSTVIVDRQGRIAARIVGIAEAGQLAAIVDRLLAEPA